MIRIVLCLSFMLAACGDNLTAPSAETCGVGLVPYDGVPDAFKTVYLWIQDDPGLGKLAAAEGCGLWLPVGVQCSITPYQQAGQVRIYAKHDACKETPSGGYVLATSYGGGNIEVQMECLRELFVSEEADSVNQQVLKLVLAHELGHQAGMWWHVPAKCEDSAAHGDFEKGLISLGICGPSLMNAMIDVNACFMTDIDAEAYAQRDPSQSPFPRVTATEMPDGCILTYRPAP